MKEQKKQRDKTAKSHCSQKTNELVQTDEARNLCGRKSLSKGNPSSNSSESPNGIKTKTIQVFNNISPEFDPSQDIFESKIINSIDEYIESQLLSSNAEKRLPSSDSENIFKSKEIIKKRKKLKGPKKMFNSPSFKCVESIEKDNQNPPSQNRKKLQDIVALNMSTFEDIVCSSNAEETEVDQTNLNSTNNNFTIQGSIPLPKSSNDLTNSLKNPSQNVEENSQLSGKNQSQKQKCPQSSMTRNAIKISNSDKISVETSPCKTNVETEEKMISKKTKKHHKDKSRKLSSSDLEDILSEATKRVVENNETPRKKRRHSKSQLENWTILALPSMSDDIPNSTHTDKKIKEQASPRKVKKITSVQLNSTCSDLKSSSENIQEKFSSDLNTIDVQEGEKTNDEVNLGKTNKCNEIPKKVNAKDEGCLSLFDETQDTSRDGCSSVETSPCKTDVEIEKTIVTKKRKKHQKDKLRKQSGSDLEDNMSEDKKRVVKSNETPRKKRKHSKSEFENCTTLTLQSTSDGIQSNTHTDKNMRKQVTPTKIRTLTPVKLNSACLEFESSSENIQDKFSSDLNISDELMGEKMQEEESLENTNESQKKAIDKGKHCVFSMTHSSNAKCDGHILPTKKIELKNGVLQNGIDMINIIETDQKGLEVFSEATPELHNSLAANNEGSFLDKKKKLNKEVKRKQRKSKANRSIMSTLRELENPDDPDWNPNNVKGTDHLLSSEDEDICMNKSFAKKNQLPSKVTSSSLTKMNKNLVCSTPFSVQKKQKNDSIFENASSLINKLTDDESAGDSILDEIQCQMVASERDLEKLKNLEIHIDWELSPLHQIDTGSCKVPRAKLREILGPAHEKLLSEKKFSEEDEEKIKKSWEEFSSMYHFNKPELFYPTAQNFGIFKKTERHKFKLFLAKYLPDRHLLSVYKKFVSIYSVKKTGRWSDKEDRLLLEIYHACTKTESSTDDRFNSTVERKEKLGLSMKIIMTKALNRTYNSVDARLKLLLGNDRAKNISKRLVDLGEEGRQPVPGKKVMLFMARGLYHKWKMPVVYYIVSKSVKSETIVKLISNCVSSFFKTGLDGSGLRPRLSQQNSKDIAWTQELEGAVIHYLIKKSKVESIQDLRYATITYKVWHRVCSKLELPFDKVVNHWKYHLYPQIFARQPVERSILKTELIKWFYNSDIKYSNQIDWRDLSKRAGDLGSCNLSKIFITLVRNFVPKKLQNKFRESVVYLHDKYMPKLQTDKPSALLIRKVYDPKTRTLSPREEEDEEENALAFKIERLTVNKN